MLASPLPKPTHEISRSAVSSAVALVANKFKTLNKMEVRFKNRLCPSKKEEKSEPGNHPHYLSLKVLAR